MKVFIAGAGGYIGQPLCQLLLGFGHEVVAFDTWWFGKYLPAVSSLSIAQGDIRTVEDHDLVGVDAVIDLAGLSNDASGDLDPQLTEDINVKGAMRLADLAKRAGCRYVYSSSASVYGSNSEPYLKVGADLKPQTAYATSKVRVEDYLRAIADRDFRPTILRNGTVYGYSKRMRFDLVVNAMTRDAYTKRFIDVGGRGDQWRPFIHITDLVQVFAKSVQANVYATLNVATENYQIAAIAGMVLGRFPLCSVMWHEQAPTDRRSYSIDTSRLDWLCRRVPDGIAEVEYALRSHMIDPEDPTAWTVKWYKTLPEFRTSPAG